MRAVPTFQRRVADVGGGTEAVPEGIGDDLEPLEVTARENRCEVVRHPVAVEENFHAVVLEGDLAATGSARTDWSRTRNAMNSAVAVWAAWSRTLRSEVSLVARACRR